MNTILKVFVAVSAALGIIFFVFRTQMNMAGYMMFLAVYIPLAGITLYDEFMIPGQFPVKVFLLEKRYGTHRLKEKRARRIKDKFGKYAYDIRGEGKTKAFDFKHIETFKTGFRGEDVLFIYSPAPGQFHPITLERWREKAGKKSIENIGLDIIPQELLGFSIETHRDKYAAHPDKQKGILSILTSPAVVTITLAIFLFVVIIADVVYWQEVGSQKSRDAQATLGTYITVLETQEKVNQQMVEYSERLDKLMDRIEGKAPEPVPEEERPPH